MVILRRFLRILRLPRRQSHEQLAMNDYSASTIG